MQTSLRVAHQPGLVPMRVHDSIPHRPIGVRRRTAGGWFGALCIVFAAATAPGDDSSLNAITEYENTPRLLISLLYEPHAAAVTPDGKLLATGHDDGSIVLWSTETGLPVRSLVGHADTVASLAFDASGSRLASAGFDAGLRLWNVEDGKQIHALKGPASRLTTVAVSPDGERLVSGSYDKIVRLWDLKQPGAEPVLLSEQETTVRAAAFSPSGEQIAIGDDAGTLCLWDTNSLQEAGRVAAHTGPLRSLLFSPDGESLVSGGDDGAVIRWDAETLERQQPQSGAGAQPLHQGPVTCMRFSPDQRLLATADQRGQVQTWDVATGEVTSLLEGHQDEILGLAFLSRGEALLTVSRDRTANVWRSKLPATPRLATIDDVDVRMWALAVSPDGGTLFAGGRDGFLAAWDLETGRRATRYEGFDGRIDALALTADGSHIACCDWRKQNVVIFETQSGKTRAELPAGTKVRCVRFSPDGRWLVAGGEDGTLRIWSWRSSSESRTVPAGTVPAGALAVYDVAFSPDGKQLVTCSGDWRNPVAGDVTFWSTDGWSEIRRLTEHTRAVRSVTFDRSGTRVASAGQDGLVILWHAETHVPLARLQNGTAARPVAFSPDGRHLAVGLYDGTINVWDTGRSEVVQRFQSEDDVFAVTYTRDGTALFSASGEECIEIWPTIGATSTAERIERWQPRD